jgi:hypothetical protein
MYMSCENDSDFSRVDYVYELWEWQWFEKGKLDYAYELWEWQWFDKDRLDYAYELWEWHWFDKGRLLSTIHMSYENDSDLTRTVRLCIVQIWAADVILIHLVKV